MVSTYNVTSKKQLIDLNGDMKNFELTFTATASPSSSVFEAIVVDQKMLDNNEDIEYKTINTGSIGKPGFLDWNMVVEMQKKGNVFGSHGHNHLKMTDISLQESKYEFIKSKELYELNTGMEISLFSFPHGLYNNRLLELSIECGYSNCFISKHGVIHLIGGVIPRNSINSSMDNSDISKILNPSIVVLSKWFLEDKIKYIVKNIIGEHFYKILRRMVLKSTI